MLFFSIPYDEGWTITVDNIATPIQIVDYGMMSVFVDSGTHEVELNYTVPYLKAGAVVSGVSLLLFAGLLVVGKSRNRKENND